MLLCDFVWFLNVCSLMHFVAKIFIRVTIQGKVHTKSIYTFLSAKTLTIPVRTTPNARAAMYTA